MITNKICFKPKLKKDIYDKTLFVVESSLTTAVFNPQI